MTECDTSEEELSISSDPRRDSAEMKNSNDPSLRDHGIQRQGASSSKVTVAMQLPRGRVRRNLRTRR
jgi:hypothetical protein